MTRKSHFEYELQPVLLRRQWDLDALKLDLNKVNEALTRVTQESVELQRKAEAVGNEWKNQSLTSDNIVADRFSTVLYYLDDVARRLKEIEAKKAELDAARESIIDRIALAQRSLDAIEQHRDEMQERFMKQRMNIEFKVADDHWSMLQTNTENHDHQS